ncbi:hemicentin-1-like isoform X2 [Pecten maximus]|uniref:hemicentin-1-like isoform X2 n=1 Tax=Pecten maximus TaxID=6579 RepID=UPI001458EB0D|nr:hemicentin-1-like isoform X2 [Pecten maximus]
MLLSLCLLLLSAVTLVTGKHHCDSHCTDHCCPWHHHNVHDCSICVSHCCTTPAPVHSTAGPIVYSEWSTCDVNCGGGNQYRHCISNCPQQHMPEDVQQCNTQPCNTTNVNGGWGTWSSWSPCSVSCGSGHRNRTRVCDNPTPQHGGHYCHGHNAAFEHCTGDQCTVNGGWGAWSTWSVCSSHCGPGHRRRTRVCNNPIPQHGGHRCHGINSETEACTSGHCPIQGGWSAWSNWSSCSVSCGTGHRTRTRVCDNPTPQHGGHSCHGHNWDTEACTSSNCTIQGGWGVWSNWSSCSVSCGTGHRTRTRVCDNPTPQYGGHNCSGLTWDRAVCTSNSSQCPPIARPTIHPCDKLSVLHALAEIDTTSKVTCLDNWTTETEGFLMQHCNAPNDIQLWHEGIEVLHSCLNMDSHLYMPVGTFTGGHTYGSDNFPAFAGIFVGCNAQHTGFKIATKICGGVAEIIEIPLPLSFNHTSTGIIPIDPSKYHFIKWV